MSPLTPAASATGTPGDTERPTTISGPSCWSGRPPTILNAARRSDRSAARRTRARYACCRPTLRIVTAATCEPRGAVGKATSARTETSRADTDGSQTERPARSDRTTDA